MGEIFTREQAKASDKALYDLMMAAARMQQNYEGEITSIHYFVKDSHPRKYDSRSGWKLSDQEAVDKVAARAADESLPGYVQEDAQRHLDKLSERVAALKTAEEAVQVQQGEWAEHGMWPRYTVVPGGHIHSDMGCFTFHRGLQRTDVRWAYPVSGDSVEEAIEVYGSALCTHCYPDAPVEKTLDKVGMTADGDPMTKAEMAAVKDARDAEKAAKLAAKNATQVVDPITGEVLYKTERGATNDIASTLKSMRWYDFTHPDQDKWEGFVTNVVAAVAAKRDVDPVELRKEFDAKADKAHAAEIRKNWRELKAGCARGRWTKDMIDMNTSVVRYGRSIGEELVFLR